MAILNIFIDESGSFDFTPKGSKYFILTAIAAMDCEAMFPDFFRLKHELGCEEFHATEDRQSTRDRMYDFIERHCAHGCFSIDSLIAQKNKVNPAIREDAVFYGRLLRILLKWVFRYRMTHDIERINVWAARLARTRRRRCSRRRSRHTWRTIWIPEFLMSC